MAVTGIPFRQGLEIRPAASYIVDIMIQHSAYKFSLPDRIIGSALLLGLLLPC